MRLPKRLLTQVAFFFAQNPFVGNFFKGGIYRGGAKRFCTPGLNCYSCPAAAASCPIGSLQLFFAGAKHNLSLYITGFLVMVSVFFGRFICGFVCPMGLLQDLLYRIKSPKLKLKLRFARYGKYAVLAVFVVILPIVTVNIPWFCKYICPSGTIFGALPLISTDENLRALTGALFALKVSVAVGLVAASATVYRFFCRVLCPLGAIYALFNGISVVNLKCDRSKCNSCGVCAESCHVGINPVETPNSPECIRCGSCVGKCGRGAIRIRVGQGLTGIPEEK